MATEERDSTDDWIVPAERLPPSALELQRQIDVATGIARAAEEAALESGQAAIEAAEQARLAAAHAERSAEASVAAARAAATRPGVAAPPARVDPDLLPDRAPAQNGAVAGHEEIPGSELPVAWSPVGEPAVRRASRPVAQPDAVDERMIAFRRRAERLMARLARLEAVPPVS